MKEVESNFRELLQNSPDLVRQVMAMLSCARISQFESVILQSSLRA